MADEAVDQQRMDAADRDEDLAARARQIDALMAGLPAGLPAIVVVGDEAVFGIRPIRHAS